MRYISVFSGIEFVATNAWPRNDATRTKMVVHAMYPTPEQAVEATLGGGTCRRVLYEPTGVLVCSECGAGMPKQLDKYCYLHYCPNCGRKVSA